MEREQSVLIRKEPCPECGSRDNLARYSDGHAYCFSSGCDYYEPADGEERKPIKKAVMSMDLIQGEVKTLSARGINADTCALYGYKIGRYRNETVHIAPLSLPDGSIVAQQLRTRNKEFPIIGDFSKKPFFGMNLVSRGMKVVVTEGHLDAMSVSQVQGNKYPALSVPNGADGAKKAFSQHMEYFSQFDEIVLMFDNDEAGKKALAECAPLFPVGKCRIATIQGFKDANQALMEDAGDEIIKAIWGAKPYKPHGIISGLDVLEEGDKPIEWGLSYPYPFLTSATYGIRPHEMIAIGSGTGCGKTDVLKEFMAHLIVEHDQKVLAFLLEEPNQSLTMDTIAGKVDSKLYHVPDAKYCPDKKWKTKQSIAENLFMYDVGNGIETEDMLSLIRFAVVALGVRHVFLDHITYIMDMVGEREQLSTLKKLMRGLNDLNKELPFTLFYVSHLRKADGASHEEGGRVSLDDFAGGKANVQYANFVIALERDQQAEDNNEKNTTILRMLKDRYTGHSTGQTTVLVYNPKTGRKTEQEPFEESMNALPEEDTNPF